eukprot:TRINITY_DN83545_c0_g1_i1.p1 TRINITY_DN83545_c0_g1~~TRINITY_DN83545_c0_g1_i1.p1  ORF type:complete len:149 (+),score=21.59 TRINITY_DN83545_c0_g1_i1:63-509(+)
MGAHGSRQEQQPAPANSACSACEASRATHAGKAPRPPNREQIGRAAWRYVHAMAAHYPEEPALQEQAHALSWLRAFLKLYPCHLCAQEFIEVCRDLPPRLRSREDYAMWWCEAHNRVRADLSQALTRCEPSALLTTGLAGRTLDEGTS